MDHHSVKRTPKKGSPNQRRKPKAGEVIDGRKDESVEKVEEQAEHKGLCSSAESSAAKQSAGDVLKNTPGRGPSETEKDDGIQEIKYSDGQPAVKDRVEGPAVVRGQSPYRHSLVFCQS